MHKMSRAFPAMVTLLLVLGFVACAQDAQRNDFAMRGTVLWRGSAPFVLRAIAVPGLGDPGRSPQAIVETLHRAADVGANAVCFDLDPARAAESAKAVAAVADLCIARRMGVLCRVFPEGGASGDAYREQAIRAIGEAFRGEDRVVYWLTGPDSGNWAARFKQAVPGAVVAAESGGDLRTVSTLQGSDAEAGARAGAQAEARALMLLGAIPESALRKTVHCVLPAGDASFAAFEAAMADPAEAQPWTSSDNGLTEQERAGGWVSLFDGKTLDGWWILGENKDGFGVEDGAIVWKAVGGGALYTRDRYENFVLRLEWKIGKGGNSGIYLRAPRTGRQSRIGMEFQLQGDASVLPVTNQTTGSIYAVLPPASNAARPEGEWNTLEISLDGPHLKAVLNGQVVQDAALDANDELRMRLHRGFIGLQDHACSVAFRNIRIKKL